MRLLAFADLHGRCYSEAARLIHESAPDWIVLLGDILPDFLPYGPLPTRLDSQRNHWEAHSRKFHHAKAVTTFVRGNHELEGFLVPEDQFQVPEELIGQVLRLEGIPSEHGAWGWSREWDLPQLEAELSSSLMVTNHPTVILSHVPPFGLKDLDASREPIGHRPLRDFLDSVAGRTVSLVLCGHVHESRGALMHREALVVNVSGGYAALESSGTAWNLTDLGTLPSVMPGGPPRLQTKLSGEKNEGRRLDSP